MGRVHEAPRSEGALPREANSLRAWFAFGVGAVALHAIVGLFCAAITPMAIEKPRRIEGKPAAIVRDTAASAALPIEAQRRRRELVRHARELRKKGDLRLGAFILAANAIDAREENALFDLERASALYRERLVDLTRALKRHPPEEAVPAVFSDLSYAGLPGGRMGDTLLTGSGSCEPISHLIVATLYDAGRRDVRFRYYGGASGGVTHLAPVLATKDGERDLVSGELSTPGGETFAADELVDAYARVHGLDERGDVVASGRRGSGPAEKGSGLFADLETPTRSMTAGYPANGDKFDGALPLYAGRAVSPPTAPGDKPDAPPPLPDYSATCAFLIKPGELDPPHAIAVTENDTAVVELYRTPSDQELDRTSSFIAQLDETKKKPATSPEERVMLDGCLAALYDRASIEFALAGEIAVSTRASLEAADARRDGASLIDTLGLGDDRGKDELKKIAREFGGGAWVLLFLPGGDAATIRLAEASGSDTFDGITFLTALLVNAPTRERALHLADALDMERRIEVMHELAHAHDDARPWSAAYVLDPPAGSTYESPFLRAYRVFLPMSWRLWEAALPETETLDALVREADAASLDGPTKRALIGYYVRNAIWIYAKRSNGGEVMFHIDAWLKSHGFGPLLAFDEMRPTPVDIRHIQETLESYAALHKP